MNDPDNDRGAPSRPVSRRLYHPIQQARQEFDRAVMRQIVRMLRAGHESGDGRATDQMPPQLLARAAVANRAGKEVDQPFE